MMAAHADGCALVITCVQEHAEFYCEGLQSKGLTSTIEPED
jgi:ATP-dependent Clp protease adaptor protein ClpS